MKIAVVGHVRFPIAPPFAGGMEAFTHALVQGLIAKGHDVRLFAAGDSDASVPLVPIVDRHYEQEMPWAKWQGSSRFGALQRWIFARCWKAVEAIDSDIIHNNSLSSDLVVSAAASTIPMVTTLHVPPFKQLANAIEISLANPLLRYVTVSRAQLAQWSPSSPSAFRAIPNGIDVAHWRPRGPVGRDAIWAGRITPTKGTGDAVSAARRAGVSLNIFGPIEDEGYFAREVAPHLGEHICYYGSVDPESLAEHVARASVALITPCWEEPFGLVAAEALTCGTPVAGYRRGAIPEVVGECGLLVDEGDIAGLARAILEARGIDRAACRKRGLQFRHEKMIAAYERLYADTISARSSSCSSTELELA